MSLKNTSIFLFCVLVTLGAGAIGGFATASEIGSWYSHINKPTFKPPNYLFGPVWTLLYFLLSFALYTIFRLPKSRQKSRLLFVFFIQLMLNILWSFLFFRNHWLGFAAFEMLVLWIFIFVMIRGLLQVNKTVAYIQVPYLLWVSFAFILNVSIFYLN